MDDYTKNFWITMGISGLFSLAGGYAAAKATGQKFGIGEALLSAGAGASTGALIYKATVKRK